MTYTGTDATAGSEVHWYYGGTQKKESKTTVAGDASAGYIALAAKAEYGSVQMTMNGTPVFATEYSDASGNTKATEASGTLSIKYTGIAAGQSLEIDYLDIATLTLSEVAMAQGVKVSFKIDEITEDVHGQVMKLKKTGATDGTATLDHLDYTAMFLETFFGDAVQDASGNTKYSTKFVGTHKGNLIGKKYNTALAVVKKYFLFGAQPTGVDKDFPSSGMYKDSLSLAIDDYMEWEAATV